MNEDNDYFSFSSLKKIKGLGHIVIQQYDDREGAKAEKI